MIPKYVERKDEREKRLIILEATVNMIKRESFL